MEEIANWTAPVATTIAAIMVALNLGSRFTGYGFVVFSIGAVAWMAVGWFLGQANLIWQNAVLLVVNLVGVWRWLGVRARYEKAAEVATARSGKRRGLQALTAVSRICGARVDRLAPAGRDRPAEEPEELGHLTELMVAVDEGRLAYAVLAYKGVIGVGEKLFAVPWRALQFDAASGRAAVAVETDLLDRAPGLDKDAWPAHVGEEWWRVAR